MRLSSSEEQELLERFMQGDREAFQPLYTSIEPQLRGHVRGCYGPQDKDVLDDILQRTALYLLEWGPTKYDPWRSKFLVYAKCIARTQAREYYKQQQKAAWSEDMEACHQKTVEPSEERRYLEVTVNPQLAAEALDEFFQLAFDPATNPPHQLIAFGFAHLCRDLERNDKTPARWPPRRIVDELSDTALQRLQEQLATLLTEAFERLPPPSVAERCNGLRQQMEKRVADVVEHLERHTPRVKQEWAESFAENVLRAQGQTPDPEARALTLLQWIVGKTCLHQYYTGKAENNITDWCHSLRRRVFRAILAKGHGELYERLLRARAPQPQQQ